jgi:hypothetical protein
LRFLKGWIPGHGNTLLEPVSPLEIFLSAFDTLAAELLNCWPMDEVMG